jgi:hypothetical protein
MATKKSMWVLLGIFVIFACVLGPAIQAEAETFKIKISNYATQLDRLPVGDVEGHGYQTCLRRGLAFFENGDIATYTNWSVGDYTKGKGPVQGYTLFSFEDGSTIVYKLHGIWEPGPQGLPLGKGAGEFTKGTGRFEGIKGNLTWTGKGYTGYSKEKGLLADLLIEVSATYTLPPK